LVVALESPALAKQVRADTAMYNLEHVLLLLEKLAGRSAILDGNRVVLYEKVQALRGSLEARCMYKSSLWSDARQGSY